MRLKIAESDRPKSDRDAGDEVVGAIEIAGRQDEGADAAIGTDHLGRNQENEGDRDRDAQPGEHGGKRARQDDLADDRPGGEVEALAHHDEVALHIVDSRIGVDRGGKEHADRERRDLRGLADSEPDDEERHERDLRDREECRDDGDQGRTREREHADREADRDAEQCAERPAGREAQERSSEVAPELARHCEPQERFSDFERRWEEELRDQAGRASGLPDQDQNDERRDPRPGAVARREARGPEVDRPFTRHW